MRVLSILVAILVCPLALACGSSDSGSGGSAVEGTWQLTNTAGCPVTLAFKGSTYAENVLCLLTGGNYGVQIESGPFSIQSNEIDFMPTQASCPANTTASTNMFAVQGQNLSVIFGATQAIFQKITPGTVQGGAVIEDGCWDFTTSPAGFTPHAIQNL
jgi:hypothetical protein